MMQRTMLPAMFLAVVGLAQPVFADAVEVTVTGVVEQNQINPPPLGNVMPGDSATLTFKVDSDDFVDSMNFPTRGYVIDENSFELTMGSETFSLQNPFPAGETPYFVLRNDDPAVDGFFTATNVDFPNGVPINQNGIFEQFRNNYSVTYTGDTLTSLDILDALGTYDFTGLTVFNWVIMDGPFKPLLIIFEEMTIAEAPECFLVFGDGPGDDSFSQGGFLFDTALTDIDASFPVLMDDYPTFTLPNGPTTMGHGGMVGGGSGSTSQGPNWPDFVNADGTFAVQVMMWNPYDVPENPEQYSQGLKCWIAPDGTVHARPFGDGTIDIQLVTGVNAQGETVFAFPFGIPGF